MECIFADKTSAHIRTLVGVGDVVLIFTVTKEGPLQKVVRKTGQRSYYDKGRDESGLDIPFNIFMKARELAVNKIEEARVPVQQELVFL